MENKTIPIADPVREFQKIKNFNNLFIKEFHKGRYVGGENVVRLEEKLKHKLKAKYIVTTNSGTDALVLSVAQLNLKKGDEILVPSFTFFATIEALMHFGLKPVFLDINKETFTVDENSFFENVSKKTKAFLPVHLFGRSSFNEKILDFCKVNEIKIIEDCAQSFGSKFKNKHLGTLGDLGAFSFFPSKTLGGIGDGGCISTNNYENFVNLKKLANHGQKNLYEHEISGVNSRLDSLNAFVLNLKLDIFENISNSRINLYDYFDKNIENNLVENARVVGDYLKEGLENLASQLSIIGDVRGRGLLLAVEVVQDKTTKSMFNADQRAIYRISELGIKNGILLYTRKTSNGENGEWLMITPPLISTTDHCDEFLSKLNLTLKDFQKEQGMI